MPVLKLTQQFIDRELKCPEGKKRIEYCDSSEPPNGVPGLYVLVTATGNITTYFLRYKDATGKTCHEKLARTTDITLTDVRKKAKTLKAEISLGADPRGEDKARKEVPTFDEFFMDHYLPHAKNHKRSWDRDEELYRLRIKAVLGQKRLNQITRQQIQLFHNGLREQGLAPATCDHHVKLLKHGFNLAIDWGLFPGPNPAVRVNMFNADNRVEHLLTAEQLQTFVTLLRTDSNRPVCLIVLFLFSTGARLNEALQAKWEQIDRQNRMWCIPAKSAKSKRLRRVPLSDSAFDVLDQLDTFGEFAHLFINRETNKPYTTIAKVYNRLRNAAGIPFFRIHDCRHGFASLLANSGRSLLEIGQILGHADPSTTQRYAHLSSGSLLAAANAASIAIKGPMPVVVEADKVEVPAEAQQAAA